MTMPQTLEITTPFHDVKLIKETISRYATGLPLEKVLKEIGISSEYFYGALTANPMLDAMYIAAQRAKAEMLADEIITIADTEEDSQKARNRIDARKWWAGKANATKWGDKIQLEVEHKVDLAGALTEARGRVLSASYQRIDREPENLAFAEVVEQRATDAISGDADDAPTLDDLLS